MNVTSAAATVCMAAPTAPPITFDSSPTFMCESHTAPSDS